MCNHFSYVFRSFSMCHVCLLQLLGRHCYQFSCSPQTGLSILHQLLCGALGSGSILLLENYLTLKPHVMISLGEWLGSLMLLVAKAFKGKQSLVILQDQTKVWMTMYLHELYKWVNYTEVQKWRLCVQIPIAWMYFCSKPDHTARVRQPWSLRVTPLFPPLLYLLPKSSSPQVYLNTLANKAHPMLLHLITPVNIAHLNTVIVIKIR